MLEHARRVAVRGKQAHARWQQRFDAWRAGQPRGRRAAGAAVHPHAAAGLGGHPAGLGRRSEGRGHPEGLWRGPRRPVSGPAGAVGRFGRPGGEQQYRGQGGGLVPARGPADQDVVGRPVRAHAPLRRPRARHGRGHERHRAARRDPRVRRHVPDLLRLHARCGPAGRTHAASGHVRVDARLHRAGRGRPHPPADRALCGAAGHPRPGLRPPGRRQRDRGGVAHHPRAQRPPGRALAVPAEPARLGPHGVRVGRGRRQGRVRAG